MKNSRVRMADNHVQRHNMTTCTAQCNHLCARIVALFAVLRGETLNAECGCQTRSTNHAQSCPQY